MDADNAERAAPELLSEDERRLSTRPGPKAGAATPPPAPAARNRPFGFRAPARPGGSPAAAVPPPDGGGDARPSESGVVGSEPVAVAVVPVPVPVPIAERSGFPGRRANRPF